MKMMLLIAITLLSFLSKDRLVTDQPAITGAWSARDGNTSFILVFEDGYFSFTGFDIPGKNFIHTYGGRFT